MRTVRRRRLKFSPKIATTMRPHGKWGDLLACLIPLSWCINILINSSFLLKLIEWQNESSLFTVKIRGKQWYWLYRIDFKNFTKIITAPKNIGHNKWVLFTHGNTKQCDDYMSALQFRRQSNWMVKFWSEAIKEEELYNLDQPMNLSFYQTVVKSIKNINLNNTELNDSVFITKSNRLPLIINDQVMSKEITTKPLNLTTYLNTMYTSLYSLDNVRSPKSDEVNSVIESIRELANPELTAIHWLKLNVNECNPGSISKLKNSTNLVFSSNAEETVRFYRKSNGLHSPINIRPTYISDDSIANIKSGDVNLTYLKFSANTAKIESKPKLYENFLVRKQKRYKLRKTIGPKKITLSRSIIRDINMSIKDSSDKVDEVMKETRARLLINKNRTLDMPKDIKVPTNKYKVFKLNKKKTDTNNLNVNRRMLRTRRTLVLPAHVNITAVTNSFDVIHSWFIPGLGLKMDCIPGRATHHTFFIDNVGFYYGQCAEICGRYHHHMPIRVCALPFDHFLLWWHHFGARRFLNPVVNKTGDLVDQLKKETAWRTAAKIEYKERTGIDISRDPKSLRKRHLNAYALRKYSW